MRRDWQKLDEEAQSKLLVSVLFCDLFSLASASLPAKKSVDQTHITHLALRSSRSKDLEVDVATDAGRGILNGSLCPPIQSRAYNSLLLKLYVAQQLALS
jgi:hypothetical protein